MIDPNSLQTKLDTKSIEAENLRKLLDLTSSELAASSAEVVVLKSSLAELRESLADFSGIQIGEGDDSSAFTQLSSSATSFTSANDNGECDSRILNVESSPGRSSSHTETSALSANAKEADTTVDRDRAHAACLDELSKTQRGRFLDVSGDELEFGNS